VQDQTATEAELTLRGLVLGVAITFLFTAANIYLGLKVGLTFATSIPAAVISMALLRPFKDAGIRENNIVQTVASAAGTQASIIFVLPGLIMVGWWANFPFWESFGVCATGGILGIMFSIPLRRAMVVGSNLPYPEGVAAAEVLMVGMGSRAGAAERRAGLGIIAMGSLASIAFAAVTQTRLFAEEVAGYFRIGKSATGAGTGLSLALVGAGHLVGLSVGLAMFIGFAMAWGIATPILTAMQSTPGEAAQAARSVWATQVRFLGAGAIGVAALWKLGELVQPIWQGIATALRARREKVARVVSRVEQDMPVGLVGAIMVALVPPMAVLLILFLRGGPLDGLILPLVVIGLVYIFVVGAFISAICGYMAGLIGSSNSPVSGVGILAVLGAGLLLALFALPIAGESARPHLVAYALFVTAIVFSAATIANDNLQDLKTGQLVGATPWRQQTALIVGALAGAVIIPPILNLLNDAYGFAGVVRPAGSIDTTPLPAPQATLISALARGVLGDTLDWSLIGIGGAVGAFLILFDGFLGRKNLMRLPPLAIGIGVYLPPGVTIPVMLGAILGKLYQHRIAKGPNPEAARRMGVLMASGLIVGESLFGVLLAGLIVGTGNGSPLALVGDDFKPFDVLLGVVTFAAVLAALYRRAARAAG
jgi:putative OPT family oligopeptide transporter